MTSIAEDEFRIDGVAYACRPVADLFPSTGERFCLRKPRAEVERYERFLAGRRADAVFELGIYDGGSTAFIAQLAEPGKLIAVDINGPLAPVLTSFIAAASFDTRWPSSRAVDGG